MSKTRKQRSAFSKLPFSAGIWVSEAEPSSSLLIPGFSVFPDFVVFPASWSGADATHIPALNTSSTSALHCFRTFCQQDGSPTNTDLLINSIDCYLEQCFFPIQVFHSVIFRESYIYIHLVSGVCADELFLEIIDITS